MDVATFCALMEKYMGIGILLGISILFHLGAALLALRLIRITGSRTVWATIAVAVFSMGVRQSLTLYRLLTGDTAALDPVAEGVAFAISLLMFFGLAAIGPLFVSLRRTQDEATRFGRILEDSRNEIYLFDAETLRLIQVNRGARENLGYTMDELRQLTPLDLKPEFDAASFEELIAPLRDGTRRNVEFSTVHRRKDGSLYPVDVHLQVAADEPSPLFVAIVLDVTEAKEVEETLRLRDRAISSAPVGIVFTDPRQEDNPVIYANPAFERITGYSAAEAIGRNPRYLQGAERDQPGLQTL
ncbi:MAG: PAS domain-containing protein, partial [Myxococcota bacterium]